MGKGKQGLDHEIREVLKEMIEENRVSKNARQAITVFLKTLEKESQTRLSDDLLEEKLLLIRYFCVLELLMKRPEERNVSYRVRKRVRFSLSNNSWHREKIRSIVDTLYDFRNRVIHEFRIPSEGEDAEEDLSENSIVYVLSSIRKILFLLFARLISEDPPRLMLDELFTAWDRHVNKGKQFSFKKSKYSKEIRKKLSSYFGDLRIKKSMRVVSIDGYGGVVYETGSARLELFRYFHDGDIINSRHRKLPTEDEYNLILSQIQRFLDRVLKEKYLPNPKNEEKVKVKYLSIITKLPQSVVFMIGYLYELIHGEKPKLQTLLRAPRDPKMPRPTDFTSRFVDVTAPEIEDEISKWKCEDLTSSNGIVAVVDPSKKERPWIEEGKKHHVITTIFHEDNSFVIRKDNIKKETFTLFNLLKTELEPPYNLLLRLPTPMVMMLGGMFARHKLPVVLYEKGRRSLGEEESIHRVIELSPNKCR